MGLKFLHDFVSLKSSQSDKVSKNIFVLGAKTDTNPFIFSPPCKTNGLWYHLPLKEIVQEDKRNYTFKPLSPIPQTAQLCKYIKMMMTMVTTEMLASTYLAGSFSRCQYQKKFSKILKILITKRKILYLYKLTGVNNTYCANHFTIYTNVKSSYLKLI